MRHVILISIVLLIVPAAAGQSLQSGTLTAVPSDRLSATVFGERWSIYVSGIIDDVLVDRFEEELVKNHITQASVSFDSPGGNVGPAMRMGHIIRERGLTTHVARRSGLREDSTLPGQCYSACVLAFIGGRFRYFGSGATLGVHRFFTDQPSKSDMDTGQIVSASIISYLTTMGVDARLFSAMSLASRDEMLLLTKEQLERLNVVNGGDMDAQWEVNVLPEGIIS